MCYIVFFFCFCKQKSAYEIRISDWSSDVCSSDLRHVGPSDRRSSRPPIGWPNVSLTALKRSRSNIMEEQREPHFSASLKALASVTLMRSEERRGWKECVCTCRYWWSPSHEKKKHNYYMNTTNALKNNN